MLQQEETATNKAINSEEIERLKHEIEQRLPDIFSILAEAIKASGVSGNFDTEIKLESVEVPSSNESQTLASESLLPTNNPQKLSVAIENQRFVMRGVTSWRKPCPNPLIAPDGCWV